MVTVTTKSKLPKKDICGKVPSALPPALIHQRVLRRILLRVSTFPRFYGSTFLRVLPDDNVPYDLFLLLGYHSLWRCRILDINEGYSRIAKSLFI